MFSVPSVTMKGGSLTCVTSSPLTRPNSVVTPTPHSTARAGGMPSSVANLVITMPPSAITMPHDRSMPAVRMTSVWPMAMTPTTITCCRMSEKLPPVRKRSDCDAKKPQATSSAMNGPSVPSCAVRAGGMRDVMAWPCVACRSAGSPTYFLPQHRSVPAATSLLSTPLIGLAAISVTPVSV